jgi:VWFA-related protein
MRRLIAVALACAATLADVSAVPVSAAGPTTRTVYVTVVDVTGRGVLGLSPAEFVVKESGKEREITSVAPASEKMRLALMVEQPLVGQNYVRVGLAEFVARMCPSAEIALFMVSQRAEKLVDFTSNPNVLVDGIRNLPLSQIQQSAAVPDAISEVAKQFEKAKPARPVIVLAAIEQGQSTDNPESILTQIAKSKAQFWAVSMTSGGAGGNAAFGRGQVIGDGSSQSGGRRIQILTLPAFETGLQQVADDLSSQYLITYTLPDGVKTSDRITVSLKEPGATLRAPSRVPK